ncbi:MAG: HD-GYP domain-containing protein [Desulfobacteraceae bacterium]|nr:HD-GYP domain-containing protein [Desulfobacteraceae bacterium]
MLEIRDPYTAGHQSRVADLAGNMAEDMGLDVDTVESIRLAGIVHDLGKIAVPAEVLSKPTRLSENEFGIIKEHPRTGYNILKNKDFPWPIAKIVLQHHERLDGSGYPNGIAGDEIRLEARILAVADVVEAMSSHRPYRPGLGTHAALQEIQNQAGRLFDEEAVRACVRVLEKQG